MWICLNNAYISIVAHRDLPDHLMIRARRKGDLECVFGNVTVETTPNADYHYRTSLPRSQVAATLGRILIESLDYDNFKSSVSDRRLHDAYLDIWSVMRRLQHNSA
jgi:hypothetical protein